MNQIWHRLRKNVRFYVLTSSILLSIVIFLWVKQTVAGGSLQTFKLTQIYAFLATIYLYISLLASPLTQQFKKLPYRGQFLRARRAIGVSAFYFAWLHTLIAFFGQLDGFSGIGFLDSKYLLSLVLGLVALLIFTAMALTAFDIVVTKLTFPKWKTLHRLVYLAGILILIHAVILGSHFSDLSGVIPIVTFVALVILLGLESLRMDRYLRSKLPEVYIGGVVILVMFLIVSGLGVYMGLGSKSGGASLNAHAEHIQLAQQAQQQNQASSSGITSLSGDRNKRFSVSFNHPDTVRPNEDTALSFEVFDASSGNPPLAFLKLFDKLSHLVIVDNELSYYSHIHPDLSGNVFSTTANFPHPGRYHLYLNYQPLGAIEQQVGFTLDVGQASAATANQPVDQNLTKTFGNYQVSLGSASYSAAKLSLGQQTIAFNIKDASAKPVTTLKPYLAAFGHLVMINEQSYDYIHVHPNNVQPPAADANGGPQVEFLPLGLYGPIQPGIYRVFAQFNPNGELILADFTIKVEK